MDKSVTRLMDFGFTRSGTFNWVDDVSRATVSGSIPKASGIYAWVCGGVVCYIGKAKKGLHTRLTGDWCKAPHQGPSPSYYELRAALKAGQEVAIYTLVPEMEYLRCGLPVPLEGHEGAMIGAFDPPWSRRKG